jgi:hypothetical protein
MDITMLILAVFAALGGLLFLTQPAFRTRIQQVLGGKKTTKIKSNGSKSANSEVKKSRRNQKRSWLDKLPMLLQGALQEENRSISIIYALLMDPHQPQVRAAQLQYLKSVEDPEILRHITELHDCISNGVDAQWHLAILDRAVDRMRSTPATIHQHLLRCASEMLDSAASTSWRSPLAYLILEHHLSPPTAQSENLLLQDLWPESLKVLAMIARAGNHKPADALHAFQTGLFRLPSPGENHQMPAECDWGILQSCLEKLAQVKLADRKILVAACAEVVAVNRIVTNIQADLLRMTAILLDCPLPPLLNQPDVVSTRTKASIS